MRNIKLINILIIGFIIGTTFLFTNQRIKNDIDEFETHLLQTTSSEAKLMTYRINSHVDNVEKVSIDERIKSLEWNIQKPFLEKSAKKYGYEAMSFTYVDGTLKSTAGTTINVKNSPPYNAFMAGKRVIGDPIVSKAHGNLVMPVAVPTFDNDDNIIGCTATDLNFTIVLESLREINLREDGIAFILNKNGDLISSTDNLEIANNNIKYNLFSVFKDNDEFINLLNDAKEDKHELTKVNIQDTTYILNSLDIADTQWNLYIAYPKSTLIKKITIIALEQLAVGFSAIIIWIIIFKVVIKHLNNALNKTSEKLATEQEKSRTDFLTGLSNKGHFEEFMTEKFKSINTTGENIALMMIDVDNFKKYNDNYGHLKGDEVLKSIGTTLKKCVSSPMDLVARFGGEEFVVALVGYTEKELEDKAQEIVTSVRTLGIPHEFSDAETVVTISVGIASLEKDNEESISMLLEKADQALYSSKKSGKNRYTKYKKIN